VVCVVCACQHYIAFYYLQFLESHFQLRNKEDHKEQCELVGKDNTGKHSKEFGINRNSLLNELKYFHVCYSSLIPDVMHDVLEGLLQYEVKLLLQHMITVEHCFTLETVNMKLENLELSASESINRPTSISPTTYNSAGNSLKQNGML